MSICVSLFSSFKIHFTKSHLIFFKLNICQIQRPRITQGVEILTEVALWIRDKEMSADYENMQDR